MSLSQRFKNISFWKLCHVFLRIPIYAKLMLLHLYEVYILCSIVKNTDGFTIV